MLLAGRLPLGAAASLHAAEREDAAGRRRRRREVNLLPRETRPLGERAARARGRGAHGFGDGGERGGAVLGRRVERERDDVVDARLEQRRRRDLKEVAERDRAPLRFHLLHEDERHAAAERRERHGCGGAAVREGGGVQVEEAVRGSAVARARESPAERAERQRSKRAGLAVKRRNGRCSGAAASLAVSPSAVSGGEAGRPASRREQQRHALQ